MNPAAIRDPESEQLERDAFRLLQHLHASAEGGTATEVSVSGLSKELGLDSGYTTRVLRFLSGEGMLHFPESGTGVRLSLPGAAYVEHLAWRRRSVRRRWS